jgi:prostaglandin-H2 D-isomerase / glutathione transferase
MTMNLQKCVLTYFDLPGRGEAIRLALTIGGVAFEDRRIPFKDWGTLKPTTPWGSMPMLDLADGNRIAQQRAVLRMIGVETGLYPAGRDTLTCAKIDELMDAVEDLSPTITSVGRDAPTIDEKLAMRQAACQVGGAVYGILSRLDQFIAANGKQTGHAVGDQWTIADLLIYTSCSSLISGSFDGVPVDTLDPFDHIQACRKLVRNHPVVQKYYAQTVHKIPPSFGPM